jgi:hypothetical protein
MDQATSNFEQVLTATLRMIRTTWKASVCLFLQMGDDGHLRIRAQDGLEESNGEGRRAKGEAGEPDVALHPSPLAPQSFSFKPAEGLVAQSLRRDQILESGEYPWDDGLAELFRGEETGKKYVVVPVAGQARVLGALILGAFSESKDVKPHEEELRSAGTLCAVLSAYWRLYEWMAYFIPQFNHELRTPLTAIQGSLGMVLGGVCGEVGSEVKQMLEMAQKGCQRTVQAIEEYLSQKPPQK